MGIDTGVYKVAVFFMERELLFALKNLTTFLHNT